jgi:hypothetical protein
VSKRVALAAASLIVTLTAGCSSSGSSPTAPASPSSGAYAQVLQRIASQEAAAQQRVADAFKTKSLHTLRQALKRFESDQTGFAAQLAALVPPPSAAGANNSLANALSDSATAIHSVNRRIRHAGNVTGAFYVIQSDLGTRQAGAAIGTALRQLALLGFLPNDSTP